MTLNESTRACRECGGEHVVSKREFQIVFNPTRIVSDAPSEVFWALTGIFQGYTYDREEWMYTPRDEKREIAGEMLDLYLTKTPKHHATHICSNCYAPNYYKPSDDVTRHSEPSPATSDDAAAFM